MIPVEKNAVILNGVSPRAQAGAKRSEESLTVPRAEAVGVIARTSHQTASAHYFQRFFTPRRPAFAHAALRSE